MIEMLQQEKQGKFTFDSSLREGFMKLNEVLQNEIKGDNNFMRSQARAPQSMNYKRGYSIPQEAYKTLQQQANRKYTNYPPNQQSEREF